MNTACMQVALRARTFWLEGSCLVVVGDKSSMGSSVCFHRQPLNICARMPKGKESSIHVQFISSVSTCSRRMKSSPLYIQYRMAPPNRMGKMILATLVRMVFISMGTKVQIKIDTCQ